MPVAANQLLTAEIVVQGAMSAAGADAQNTFTVFHYKRAATAVDVNKAAVWAAFSGHTLVPLAACLNHTWASLGGTVRMMEDNTNAASFNVDVEAGAIAGDRLPPYVTAYLVGRTALRGKAYRGAKLLGPLSESDTTSGTEDTLNAAALARFATLCTAMQTNFTDGTGNVWQPVVVSRLKSDFTVTPCNIVSTIISSWTTRKSLGRLKGRAIKATY